MKKLKKDIEKTKSALILKVKMRGIYENFGQNELRALKDKHIDSSSYTSEMNAKRDTLDVFSQWCMTYNGS